MDRLISRAKRKHWIRQAGLAYQKGHIEFEHKSMALNTFDFKTTRLKNIPCDIKGQLISKCTFGVVKYPKKPTKCGKDIVAS